MCAPPPPPHKVFAGRLNARGTRTRLPRLWGHLFTRRCRTPPARSMLEEDPPGAINAGGAASGASRGRLEANLIPLPIPTTALGGLPRLPSSFGGVLNHQGE